MSTVPQLAKDVKVLQTKLQINKQENDERSDDGDDED